MASKEHKIVRRAEAMSQLGFLSQLLAEQFNLQPVSVETTNRDSELAEIQRIESINELLRQLVGSSSVKDDNLENNAESVEKPVKKHAANK